MSIPIMLSQFGLGAMDEAVQLIWDEWALEQQIVSDDIAANDRFGYTVALSGDGTRMAIAAILEDGGGSSSGAVYVFSRDGNNWTQEQKLLASDAQSLDYLGYGVSMSEDGSRLIVSALGEDAGGSGAGAAYVFSRSGTTWTQEQKLTASDASTGDAFGRSVSMSEDGTRVIVGAVGEDTSYSNAGAAYVFSRSGTTWTQEQKLTASDPVADDDFGRSVSITGDGTRVIVGAALKESGDAGAAYVFSRSGTTWTQEQKLTASNASNDDEFGQAVSISKDGTRVAVGAPYEDTRTTNAGAVYVFSRSGTTWTQEQIVTHDGTTVNSLFGSSVSMTEDGTRLAVGAWGDNTENGEGAVYVFSRSGTTWTQEQTLDITTGTWELGFSISMTHDGTRVVAGAPTTTGFARVYETGYVDPSTIPEFIDAKSTLYLDSRSFDAVGDLTLTDMTFEAGDLIFINITCQDFGGQTMTWSGDVDFIQLKQAGDTNRYHGYAVLDGTETDIYLDPTTTGVDQLYISVVNVAIFRNASYITGLGGSEFSTSSDQWYLSSTNGSTTAEGHELIIGPYNFDDTVSITPSSVTGGYHATSSTYNGPGTADIGSSLLYGVVDRQANPITIYGETSREEKGYGQAYRFSGTQPTNANITLVGSASTSSVYGVQTVDVSGIDIQAGDLIFVSHSSASDIDSSFTWRTNTDDNNPRTMNTMINGGGQSTMPHTSAYIIATGDETSVYCLDTSTNWDYTNTAVAVFRSTDLSFINFATTLVGSTNNADLALSYTPSLIFPGNLMIAQVHSDYYNNITSSSITGPSGWNLAVSANGGDTFRHAKTAIFYRVDYGDGDFNGDTFSDGNTISRQWFAYTSEWT